MSVVLRVIWFRMLIVSVLVNSSSFDEGGLFGDGIGGKHTMVVMVICGCWVTIGKLKSMVHISNIFIVRRYKQ